MNQNLCDGRCEGAVPPRVGWPEIFHVSRDMQALLGTLTSSSERHRQMAMRAPESYATDYAQGLARGLELAARFLGETLADESLDRAGY